MQEPNLLPKDDSKRVAAEIAEALGEKQHGPRKLVRGVVEQCGVDFAREILRDTETVMAAGGMLTAAADRLRTKGGVFFYLARGRMTTEQRQAVFPPRTVRNRRKDQPDQSTFLVFNWDARQSVLAPLLAHPGEVRSVKITLIGRPGQIETRQDLIITTMSHSAGSPTLPRGVPAPPETPTLYTVYIGSKQWQKIASALDDPEDMLIIEGLCAFDPELQAVAVYANRVTSKATEATKRPAAKADNGIAEKPPAPAAPPAPEPAAPPIPDNVPAKIATKLRELRAAADLYRQKIAKLEAQPQDQRFGLEMTQKLLKNVEDEISALEKQYV
jgi:hypothetical protein